ncbi:hypothetical protein DERP_010395 [Dermatophagoides pteronyssinus]|uniref:Uncharacterized protein n=1 Tax=Dermatophagoides pteronyssinus TaxID=6956 RepID=A0ABQ8J528_DERPT|nr:hypothetical protein DERP_010395 [Dermatophagoides pteronyssinus]
MALNPMAPNYSLVEYAGDDEPIINIISYKKHQEATSESSKNKNGVKEKLKPNAHKYGNKVIKKWFDCKEIIKQNKNK